jgi:hypothetical protein
MAIKAFNSVAGFSVGENPTNIILGNGDITTGNASLTGNIVSYSIFTDNYYYANGSPLDFQLPSGADFQLQFGNAGNFDSTPKLVWNPDANTLEVTGKITTTGNITAPYFVGNFRGNISGNLTVPGLNQAVLYNDQGIAGSSDAFLFDETSNVLTLNGTLNVSTINANSGIAGLITTAAQPNITSLGNLTSLTVEGNTNSTNVNISNNLAVSNNANVDGNLRVENTATIYNLIASGILYPTVDGAPNQIIATDGAGNLGFVTIETDKLANGTSNIKISQDSNITISINGYADRATFHEGGIDVVGNLTSTENVISNTLTANTKFVANNINITSANNSITGVTSLDASSIVSANANITHTLTTSNLSVANVVTDLIPNINSTYSLGATTYKWNNIYLGGNLFLGNATINTVDDVVTTANANITDTLSSRVVNVSTELNALGNVTISGNLTVGGSTEYINVTSLSIKDPLILVGGDVNGGNAAIYDGKDRGLLLQNYKSDGTGIHNQFFGWKTANSEFVAASNVTDFTGEVVVQDNLANIRGNTFIGNLLGTVTTAAQPNITSLGTLTSVAISGDANIIGTANIGVLRASNLTYPITDGEPGQVLTTNGSGAMFFTTPVTNQISNGTTVVTLEANANVRINAGGTANVMTVSGAGLNITGYANTTGDIVAGGNISTSNDVKIGITAIKYASTTTSSTLAGQVIASVSAVGIRAVEFFVKGEEELGSKYSVASVSVVHNGSAVDYSVYGTVALGGSTGVLNVSYNTAADTINLTVTPASSNTTLWTTQFKTI